LRLAAWTGRPSSSPYGVARFTRSRAADGRRPRVTLFALRVELRLRRTLESQDDSEVGGSATSETMKRHGEAKMEISRLSKKEPEIEIRVSD
jgi:hypothetical protein